MARQENFKHKNYLCSLASLPTLCIVYLHCALTKLPHCQKYLFNRKGQRQQDNSLKDSIPS